MSFKLSSSRTIIQTMSPSQHHGHAAFAQPLTPLPLTPVIGDTPLLFLLQVAVPTGLHIKEPQVALSHTELQTRGPTGQIEA